MGLVYMAREPRRLHMAHAYSATTVLPAEVCAATRTDWLRSRQRIACFWKVSSSNGHSNAGSGTNSVSGASVSVLHSYSMRE